MTSPAPWRRLLAEFIGTALLLAAVVGSGIMALLGAALAVLTISALYPRVRETATDVVLPHEQDPASPDGRPYAGRAPVTPGPIWLATRLS